jgi:hypothetical protein
MKTKPFALALLLATLAGVSQANAGERLLVDLVLYPTPPAGELPAQGVSMRVLLEEGETARCQAHGPVFQTHGPSRCTIGYRSQAIAGDFEITRIGPTNVKVTKGPHTAVLDARRLLEPVASPLGEVTAVAQVRTLD